MISELAEEKILAFAESAGYGSVEYAGVWNRYDAYQPICADNADTDIGLPVFILAADDIRVATPNEAFSIIDALFPED